VYFCAGDADALLLARHARVLVATARELGTLRQTAVELDALVSSGKDEAERYQPGQLDPEPRLVVTTSGALGGWAQPGGPYTAAALPREPADSYGAGDCFAAGLAFALSAGLVGLDALDFAARCGAGALAGPGVHAEVVPLP
jgi:ribokinase